MIIRRNDFGNIDDLSQNSHKKIWFTCEKCGIGVLQSYRNYLKQKNGKLCRYCRNSITSNNSRKIVSEKMKEKWKNVEYKRKMSKKLSDACKKSWENDNGKRRKNLIKNNPMFDKKISKKVSESEATSIEELKKLCEYYNYEFIERILGKRGGVVIKFKCDKGHIQEKRLDVFKRGSYGCYECNKKSSVGENEIYKFLKENNIKVDKNSKSIIYPFELDIVIPNKKIAIEYCGLYLHSETVKRDKNYHLNKLNLCNEAGYRLITIFEDEWKNHQNLIKNKLLHILGKSNSEKIYARKCEIKEIETKTARNFCNENHIQGYNNCSIKLGLYYNKELVSLMTFSKPSLSKGYKGKNENIWELNRYCTNKIVIGGAGKLLNYFCNNYEWKEIFSFADKRWSDGNLYNKLGFELLYETKPNYFYFNTIDNKRYHRFNFRKDRLPKILEKFDPNLTEYENMIENNYHRIWDCGNILFEYERDINE